MQLVSCMAVAGQTPMRMGQLHSFLYTHAPICLRKDHLDEYDYVVVYTNDGLIEGVAFVRVDNQNTWHLEVLVVHADKRSVSRGTQVLECVTDHAREHRATVAAAIPPTLPHKNRIGAWLERHAVRVDKA